MLKDRPSAAVRQSKRKLGFAEESGGLLSLWEVERIANNGSATFCGNDAAGKAWLVANLVIGNPFKIARQTSQQGSSNFLVNDRSSQDYLSIFVGSESTGSATNPRINLSSFSGGSAL